MVDICHYPACESSHLIIYRQLQPTFKFVKVEIGTLGDRLIQVYRKFQNYGTCKVTNLVCCCCLQLRGISPFSLQQCLVTPVKREGILGQTARSTGLRKAAGQRSPGVAVPTPVASVGFTECPRDHVWYCSASDPVSMESERREEGKTVH